MNLYQQYCQVQSKLVINTYMIKQITTASTIDSNAIIPASVSTTIINSEQTSLILQQLRNRKQQILQDYQINLRETGRYRQKNNKSLEQNYCQKQTDIKGKIQEQPLMNLQKQDEKRVKNIYLNKIKKAETQIKALQKQRQQNQQNRLNLVAHNQVLELKLAQISKIISRQIHQFYFIKQNHKQDQTVQHQQLFSIKNMLMSLIQIEHKIQTERLKPMKIITKFCKKNQLMIGQYWGLQNIIENKMVNKLYGQLISINQFRQFKNPNNNQQIQKDHKLWIIFLKKLKIYQKNYHQNNIKNQQLDFITQIDRVNEIKKQWKINKSNIYDLGGNIDDLTEQIILKYQYLNTLTSKLNSIQQRIKKQVIKNYNQKSLSQINKAIQYFQQKLISQDTHKSAKEVSNYSQNDKNKSINKSINKSTNKSTNQLLKTYILSKNIQVPQKQKRQNKFVYTSPDTKNRNKLHQIQTTNITISKKNIKSDQNFMSPQNTNYLALYRSNSKRKLTNKSNKSHISVWK